MLDRRKQLCLGIIFAAVCLLLVIVGLRSRQSRQIRLPDGRTFVVEQVSYGTEHELAYGKPWYRILSGVGPRKWKKQLPLRVVYEGATGSVPHLVVWGDWTLPGTNGPAHWLIDQNAKWGRTVPVYGNIYRISSNHVVTGWALDNFPRRESSLSFELADSLALNSKPVASITIRNPVRQEFPRWNQEHFPAVRTTAGIDLVIANFCEATFISSPWLTFLPKLELSTGFAGVFQVRENGRATSNWSVDRMVVRDATGNQLTSRPILGSFSIGEYMVAGLEGPLWKTEADWKVSAEFVRSSNFGSNDLCTLKNIPIPASGSVTQELVTAQANGITIIGVELTSRGRGFNPLRMSQDLEIEPLLPKLDKEDFVSLVEVRDDAGRLLRFEKGRYGIEPFHFGIELPGGSRSLDLTFALHKRLTAEWTVGIAAR